MPEEKWKELPAFMIANEIAEQERRAAMTHPTEAGPEIITLCGSSRFIDQMAVVAWEIEKSGRIALGLHLLPAWYTDQADHQAEHEGIAEQMDELHLRKIDLADKVWVIDGEVDGKPYIGESTAREIEYARSRGKPVKFWSEMREPAER